MVEIGRRTSIKLGIATVVGAFVGSATNLAEPFIEGQFSDLTGLSTGNASVNQTEDQLCGKGSYSQKCVQDYEHSAEFKLVVVLEAPIIEEGLFRTIPSIFVSSESSEKAIHKEILVGSGRLGMTRRELIVGTLSSLIFGGVHNITNKGLDMHTMPITQILDGSAYWYLQRRFGIAANTLAHSVHNLIALG